MKNRTLALPLIAVAAVVALTLGSFGTATAAGLTTHTVKKIAAKVVKKKAPGLSVAHAVTADKLNGQPASAYLNPTTTVYNVPVTTSATSHTFAIPVTAGRTYQVSYAAYMSSSSTGNAGCYLYRSGGGTAYFGETRFYISTNVPSASGVGIVPIGAGQTLNLYCFAPSAWTTITSEPVQIAVTPVSAAAGSPITPSRPAAGKASSSAH